MKTSPTQLENKEQGLSGDVPCSLDLSELDVVYTVRLGDNNEELKCSVRSLVNLPHRNVWMAGYLPSWTRGVYHLTTYKVSMNKVCNTDHNWVQVAMNREISEPFILMNDDFFVMKPVDCLPSRYVSTHEAFLKRYQRLHPFSYYTKVIQNTTNKLKELGIEKALCYELHTPMIIYKKDILQAMQNHNYRACPVNIRSLAGNVGKYGGKQAKDVKVYDVNERLDDYMGNDFISTQDISFNGQIGNYIRNKFKEKSDYER